ncbi:ABC transporter ATP-binding protein [Hydrogenophaga laconesensis]|uniref:Branched-chain amino acid transport system ATP-binding protein n=1 Tax=Hydrogenophaga laconesensis TaxID=1805971 RepID=A0ABU1VFY2_9BURK|nr:ABC transporter ATP-binding protein [Hydrogenophaga laconesensis]MDR7096240.1 branched-chain amino acid transport system ATP-binding protein [Hydrogenophaga laconesensis]
MAEPLLTLHDVRAWYGPSQALHGASLDVHDGEVVTLLGRNGAGKSTLLKTVMGMIGRREGSIRFRGHELIGLAPHHIGRLGVAFCPDDRGIYASLSVRENLRLPPVVAEGGMSEQELYDLFPNLAQRANSAGTHLSGGEQQMLAIARILRTGARVLLLDEPTEGLAPVIVDRIGDLIRQLKGRGYTIVLVEQNVHFAAELADRHCLMESGRITDTFDAATLLRDFEAITARIGV